MSETSTATPTPADVAPKVTPAAPAPPNDQSPTETVDFWKTKAREQEKRAKENAEAAKRLTELEEAQKTAEQKAAERLAEAEKRAAELEAKATIAEIAAASSIPADILAGPRGITPEAVQEYADKITAFLDERGKPRTPRPNPAQGEQGQTLPLNGDGLENALRAKLGIR